MSIDDMSLDEAMGDNWRPGVHYAVQAEVRISILAAEVRRLRAMLEPTPDARELAIGFLRAVAGRIHEWVHRNMPGYSFVPIDYGKIFAPIDISYIAQSIDAYAAKNIAAYRTRLLDEAAERGVELVDAMFAHLGGLTPGGKDKLRAVINEAAHE